MLTQHQTGETLVQRYHILALLGKGGIGLTYQAQDLQTQEKVAIKAVSLRQLKDWKQIELFEREAEVLRKLNHPAIPTYLDYFSLETETDKRFYLVQELAPGKPLSTLVEEGWRTNEAEIKQIVQQILDILIYLHGLNPPVIHRDIKPQNLIRSDEGKVFLVDFGAVQNTYYTTMMRGSTVVGTYGYMAPEQFRGKAVSATDLYGLGATILYLLTHRSPAELPHDTLKVDFRSQIKVSEGFANWLEQMLEPDLEERFSSAKEALAGLRYQRFTFGGKLSKGRWKTWLGAGVGGIAVLTGFNFYKWGMLSTLGLQPTGLCDNSQFVRDYLNNNGFDKNLFHPSINVLKCNITQEDKDIVELLIAKGVDVHSQTADGLTILHWAAANGDKDIVKLLIAQRVNVNTKTTDGKTPLYGAVENGHKEIVELLINKGADVNTKNNNGQTLLYGAAKNGHKEIVELLINKGADVNTKDNNGQTPLYRAAENGDKDIVELLINKGADVNTKDNIRQTPVRWAAEYGGHKEIVELLIAKGADINIRTIYGWTPIHAAIRGGHKDIVELLIAKGMDVNAKNIYGQSLLHLVAGEGNKGILELLIAKGANLNPKDQYGFTPLHWAAERTNKEIVELLIVKGANVNARDNDGFTPLYHAIRDSNQEIIDLLKTHGAK